MFIQMLSEEGTYLTLNSAQTGLDRSHVTATKGSTFKLLNPLTLQELNPRDFVGGAEVLVEVWGFSRILQPHWMAGTLSVGSFSFLNAFQYRMRVHKVNASPGNFAIQPGDVFALGSPLTYPWGHRLVHKWLRNDALTAAVDVAGQGDTPTAGGRETFVLVPAPFLASVTATPAVPTIGIRLLDSPARTGGAAINAHFRTASGVVFSLSTVIPAGSPAPPANSVFVPFPASVTPCSTIQEITVVPAWDDPSVTTSKTPFKQNMPASVPLSILPPPPLGRGAAHVHTFTFLVHLLAPDPGATFALIGAGFPFPLAGGPPGSTTWTVTFTVSVPTSVPDGPICFTLIYHSSLVSPPAPGSWSFNFLIS